MSMKPLTAVALTFVVGAAGAAAVVWSGAYSFAADDHHIPMVKAVIETARDRSIKARLDGLAVPDFSDRTRIVQGAGNYDAMCATCHLSPGSGETELSKGLYPAPPDFTKQVPGVAHAYWVIKHGIKASGMPAWGLSMEDDYIWNMAAFVQELPQLDAAKYREMVAQSGGHSHGGGESGKGAGDHHGPAEGGHGDHPGGHGDGPAKPGSGAKDDHAKAHAEGRIAPHGAEASAPKAATKKSASHPHSDDKPHAHGAGK